MFSKKDKYKELYLDILKIGQKSVNNGLSYNKLKCKLEQKGYDFENDCIELAVKQWFHDCFHHRGQEDKKYSTVEDLDQHLDCNFILKGESCLKLISYRTSWFSMMTARIALLISFCALMVGFWNLKTKQKENLKSLTSEQSKKSDKVATVLGQENKNSFYSYDTTYTTRHFHIDTTRK